MQQQSWGTKDRVKRILELVAYAALRGFAVCAAGAARRCGDDDALQRRRSGDDDGGGDGDDGEDDDRAGGADDDGGGGGDGVFGWRPRRMSVPCKGNIQLPADFLPSHGEACVSLATVAVARGGACHAVRGEMARSPPERRGR